jgi:hypothetical protein
MIYQWKNFNPLRITWLVIYGLFHDTISNLQYSVSNNWMIMKGYERKWSWPI